MYQPNCAFQQGTHRSFRADTTLASGASQLVLPVATSRCMLTVINTSAAIMWLEHGPCRASASLTNGVVTGLTVRNAGFGYTVPPIIEIVGGSSQIVASTATGASSNGQIGMPGPSGITAATSTTPAVYNRPAKVRAVLSGGALSSFVIDDGGAGYGNTPAVLIYNAPNDPWGCADPSILITGSVYTGIPLAASGGSYTLQGTSCHTEQIALFGTSGSAFVCEWMP